MTLLDQSLVLGTLQARLGLSAEAAAELYGQYTFGMTLFVLPPSFIYPLTVSLIPAISQARTRHDDAAAARLTASALRITALLALPMGVGLSVLAGPILQLLYPAVPETAQAAAYHLTVLGIASIFVCLMVATNGILQANGRENIPIWTLLAGGALKIVTNYLMVGNPDMGIRGAPVGTLYSYALIVVLNMIAVRRCLPRPPLHPWAGGSLPLPVASGPVHGGDGAGGPLGVHAAGPLRFPESGSGRRHCRRRSGLRGDGAGAGRGDSRRPEPLQKWAKVGKEAGSAVIFLLFLWKRGCNNTANMVNFLLPSALGPFICS